MLSLNKFHGAPVIIFIFAGASLSTQFGAPFYYAYPLFLIYSLLYILLQVCKCGKVKVENKKIFLLHFVLVAYVILCFLFIELSEVDNLGLPHIWEQNSILAYLSILLANIVVLITPMKKIISSLNIIKYISYYLILESFFFYVLPDSMNIFRADHEAGYRFDGFLFNSYTITAIFLLSGYVIQFQLCKTISRKRAVVAFIIFFAAILATKERTSILAFLIINILIYYRTVFRYSPFLFKTKKSVFVIYSIFIFIILPFVLLTNVVQRDNPFSFKSTLARIALNIRSLEIVKYTMPFGSGPGSQVRLMYSDTIKTDILSTSIPFINGEMADKLMIEKEYIVTQMSRGAPMSTHNTYFDHMISLGIFGLLIVILTFYLQIKSIFRLIFIKYNNTIFFDAFLFGSFILFMFTSLLNILWVYLLIIKSRAIFIKLNS